MEEQQIDLPTHLQQLITTEQAWHYNIIPKSVNADVVDLFIADEYYTEYLREELEVLFGKSVELEKRDSAFIQKNLSRYYRKSQGGQVNSASKQLDIGKTEDFLSSLIGEAKSLGSSDIHIETYEEKCRIRIRIDGQLIEKYLLPKAEYPSLINKIKIKANLDIAEKRLPQDGRIFYNTGHGKFDIRVSVLPTLYGEKVVLRLLSNDATNIDIAKLGFSEEELENYLHGIKKPHGIVLISGPTGSGKTTTLYATLKILNKEKTNILTVEDPIEYTLQGINQVQLKESIGLTFASALRTFLRQDPDVIMLGEIRDAETAEMAIRAALTGHLVLSTIHTNSAWGTISRLIDMGVPSFLLANTLNTSVAQRLVRLLCKNCKKQVSLDQRLLPPGFTPPRPVDSHFVACGCEQCYYTGYKGRKAIYEVIPIDFELSEEIKNNNYSIAPLLRERNISSLKDNAFELLAKGESSVEELYPILLNNY